jgi:hypothetical protein
MSRGIFPIEVFPVIACVGAGVVLAGVHLFKLATDPHVVYTRENRYPWLKVRQDQNIKYYSLQPRFQKN